MVQLTDEGFPLAKLDLKDPTECVYVDPVASGRTGKGRLKSHECSYALKKKRAATATRHCQLN
ncbi:hypothetical protein [Cryobacterium algoricola]|uniref:hypothetical protein n=1 Tax=Cryobacterium algoricola TaxID=1259183 RepID=UPI001F5470D6|nr:hypothetical protein [Cryobacterium algoricola]